MSVISALFDNKVYNFEQAFGVKDITSSGMRAAITDWYGLYYNNEPNDKENPCQRLPVAIVSKLYKTTFSEYAATSKNAFAQTVLDAMGRVNKKAAQNALIGGECFLKPIFTNRGLVFSTIERRNILVLGRDETDAITSIGTAEKTTVGKLFYTLLERRTVEQGYLTIESKLYRSDTASVLGAEVPLATLDKYAELAPVNTLPQPVWSLGLVPVSTPLENCVDGSPDCVSVYAPAAGLIHQVNVNEAQINGEFERGESRIICSGDMMTVDADGNRKNLKDHVFTAVDEPTEDIGVTIFSPAFREQSFLARKSEYLRNVETLIGLKRGILSEVEAAERTATEITSSAGDYNLSIIDFQVMWENAVREAVRVCGILGKMYKVPGADDRIDTEKDISVSWGNGILYDEDKVWSQYQTMVASGLLKPEIAVGWYFNMPTETESDLAKIREKYMPEMEQMAEGGENNE